MPNSSSSSTHETDVPLISHWGELRRRVLLCLSVMIVATALAYAFVTDIYGFLVTPLAEGMADHGGSERLIYTGLGEAFFTYLRVALFTGVFLTFPVLLFHIWRFIAPALYAKEKLVFRGFLLASPVLFFAGGACVYYVVLPQVWPFFLSFQSSAAETVLPVELETRVSEYLDLIMTLIFAFGLSFQLPVVLGLLGRTGVIDAGQLKGFRKYTLLLAFIIAAFLTPPDLISQLLLALPLLVLYELSILLVTHVQRS